MNTPLLTVGPLSASSLPGLFQARVSATPEQPAWHWYSRQHSEWQTLSWREAAELVERWRAALAAEGLGAGERVALVLRNSVEWFAFEQAALALGLVVVPLYPDDRPENVAYVVENAGVRLLLVQDAGRWRRLAPQLREHTGLAVRVLGAATEGNPDQRVRFVDEWLAAAPPAPPAVLPVDPDALATIVYTSGTLGRPKGVMLSHRNILSEVAAGLAVFEVTHEDKMISFLPLAHMFERSVGYYLPIASGASVAFARSVQQLGQDLLAIQPTVMIAVPRIFEALYDRFQQQLLTAPAWRRRLFEVAVAIGWSAFERRQGHRGWHPQLLLAPLLQRLVGRRLLDRLGGRLRLAVSGGAALAPDVARVFIGLGLELCQGYGLTEASPAVTFNPPNDNVPASIGVPLPGIQTAIGESDELLVRGPTVMLGYWNDPEGTARVIDAGGWLHTGDQVRRVDGHYFIVGRLKEILVLSNGEKVPPVELENAIRLDPLFDQVLVIGEGQPYLSALVVLNAEVWEMVAESLGVSVTEPNARRVSERLLDRIGHRLHAFPGYAKVRKVWATLDPWTVEAGLQTPTLKLRRPHIMAAHAQAIASLYGQTVSPKKAEAETV